MEKASNSIRNLESLKIKIGEAKNLTGKSSCSGTTSNRDVYCTVALDQEEICRTQTERTSSPFFGEEFQFEIPRKFRYLSVYVMERDKHLKQDKAVGKIAIRREELHVYNHKDHWFPLRPVDDDSEVQGMAHMEVNILSGNTSTKNNSRSDDHLKENLNKNPSTNNYTTTLIPSSSATQQQQNQNQLLLQAPISSGTIVSATTTLNSAIHKAPKLLYSTTAPHTPTPSQQNHLEKSSSQQDISVINHNFNQNLIKQRVTYPFQQQCNTLMHLQAQQQQRIQLKLTQCRDLTKKNNSCDPYAIITATYSNKKKIVRRSKVRKKTINPQYDDVFEFNLHDYLGNHNNSGHNSDSSGSKIYTIEPLGGNDLCEITISIWHDSPGMSDDVFLGEIKLPVRGKQQLNALQPSAWYFLLPRASQSRTVRSCATPPGTRLSCENSMGSLRLKLLFSADLVFPLATYDNLLNILIQSVDQLPITTSAVYLLGDLVANKQEIAQPLVRLFTFNNLIVPIINRLAENEISKLTDPTTIFRGNTLVSKMMDEAMKLSGLHYLHSTLRPIVELILHEKKPCEIDPTRVKNEKESIEQNLNNLHDYVGKVFDAIIKSASRCPQVLCQIFHDLRETAAKYFPMNKEVRYSVVSGFIFLRFFAPAILGPKLFDLTSEPLDMQTNRTLTLISKTIQSLGNLVSSRSAQQQCKEPYTEELYKKFCTEKHVEAVKRFLEEISTAEDQRAQLDIHEVLENEPILLKDGMMTKRAQHQKRFGRRNFKQRYFRLTTQSLSYAKAKGKRPICDIPLTDLLAVERLEERSFKLQNIFRIVRKERPLYIQTANCVEEKNWVDLLSKICDNNKKRKEYYHNCAYINGEWTCCHEKDQYARGCKSMADKPFEMELVNQLDPARDLQRIHSLIVSSIPIIEKYFTSSNDEINNEELKKCRVTIQKLTDFSMQLEQIHRKYKNSLLRETKYGSQLQPIGDDNYIQGLSVQVAQQLHASSNNTGNVTSATTFLLSGSSTTPRHQTSNSHFEISPNFFHRHHILRSSDSERFSHF